MKNKSIKNFVLKEKETVKKIYIDAAHILDELTKEGVDNLIKTGFADKEICNELGKLMSSKFNKKISISSQKRMSSDKHKSYYLEFSIDWITEKNLINTIKNKIINFFILA